MSLIGKTLIVDRGEAGADEMICVRQSDNYLTLIKTRAGLAAYKPVVIQNGVDGLVTGAFDSPESIRKLMVEIAIALTFPQSMQKLERFRVQAHHTIEMLKAAHDVVRPPLPRMVGKQIEVVGPNNLWEQFLVLEESQYFMTVATQEGAIVDLKKSEWVIGNLRPGAPALRSLIGRCPEGWLLQKYLDRWTCHERN